MTATQSDVDLNTIRSLLVNALEIDSRNIDSDSARQIITINLAGKNTCSLASLLDAHHITYDANPPIPDIMHLSDKDKQTSLTIDAQQEGLEDNVRKAIENRPRRKWVETGNRQDTVGLGRFTAEGAFDKLKKSKVPPIMDIG